MIIIKTENRLLLFKGLLTGIIFGFLLQKGGVTHYEVLIGQLLLTDFTVIKIIVTAIIVGMIGIYYLKSRNIIDLHPKAGSIGSVVIGGLIFGAGFGLLGYCPGTLAGAVGQGNLDALFGGTIGIIVGAGVYARVYPLVKDNILKVGKFNKLTLPEILNIRPWKMVVISSTILILFLLAIEIVGY